MGIIVTDDKHYKNIASAIREKTNSEETYAPEKMPSGVDEVFEAGKTAEWSDFWDVVQQNGKRTDYSYGFFNESAVSYTWTEKTFNPKYDMTPTNANRMFTNFRGSIDFTEYLANLGIKLDLSKASNAQHIFHGSKLLRVPVIDVSGATHQYGYMNLFSWCPIHTVDKWIVADNGIKFIDTFAGNYALKNIVVEGIIGQSVSFSTCPLTVESIKSIISHLKDYSTEAPFTYTVTFSSACLTALDAEGNTSPNGNTWRQYAQDLGWNI